MNNSLVDDKIKELFVSYRTIAIVGVSADTNKASNRIMKFLRMIPIFFWYKNFNSKRNHKAS